MKLFKRILLPLALLVVMVFALAGCGAEVSTAMTIDENFAGKRNITLTISNDDLGKVDGGIKGLEKVIKKDIPKAMSYKIKKAEGGQTITFTVSFKDIKDYRTKVGALIKAGITAEEKKNNSNVITPEVVYERNESYFKKGIVFKENFSSVDLLDWFREGLRKAGIISESESNWFENASHVVTIEGVEYSGGAQFNVDKQENTCLSSCDVETKLLLDNSLERTVKFTANESTVTALADKGCELESYMKGLTPKGDSFKAEKSEYGDTYYIFTLKAKDAKEMMTKTNAVMQTEGNSFALKSEVDKKNPGVAKVTINETFDGSYYLNYGSYSSPVSSTLYVYNNADVTAAMAGENTISYDTNENGGVTYRPSASLEYQFQMDWQIEFEALAMDVISNGTDNITVELECGLLKSLASDLKQSAIDRIKSFVKDEKLYETEEGKITLTFSGKIAEVEAQIHNMVKAAQAAEKADGESYDGSNEDVRYFTVTESTFNTPSLFTDGVSLSVSYNFRPLFGSAHLALEESEGFLSSKYFQGNVSADEEGALYATEEGTLEVYTTKMSILGIVVCAVSAIVLLAGLFLLLTSLKSLTEWLKALKQAQAEAKAAREAQAQAYAQAQAQQIPVQVPVQVVPQQVPVQTVPQQVPVAPQAPVPPQAPVAPAAPVNTSEEEEIL